jgi:hypothetical protein
MFEETSRGCVIQLTYTWLTPNNRDCTGFLSGFFVVPFLHGRLNPRLCFFSYFAELPMGKIISMSLIQHRELQFYTKNYNLHTKLKEIH